MHNLMNNTMAYAGAEPWHKLGVRFDQDFLAEEAIVAAQLGYTVEKEPLYRNLNDEGQNSGEAYHKVNAFATVRTDTREVLGIVGDRYEPLQNRDAFAFFDNLIVEGQARYHTAGALGRGEKVWLLARTPEIFSVLPGDEVENYLLLSNAHDGSGAVEVRLTPIRVVCQNTLGMAKADSKPIVKIRHTINVEDRIAMAGRIVRETVSRMHGAYEQYEALAKCKVTDQDCEDYINAIFGVEPDRKENPRAFTMRERKIADFDISLTRGMGVDIPGVQGTAWWLYNGAVEYADYFAKVKAGTDRTDALLFGSIADFKQKAMDEALALVK